MERHRTVRLAVQELLNLGGRMLPQFIRRALTDHPAIGNAAQHLHDLIQADLAREADGEAFPGTRETGQRLCQWLSA